MRPAFFAAVSAAFWLPGCAMTLPVAGQLANGSETLKGTATGYADGGGTLKIAGSKGRTCEGSFVYVTQREGGGTFNCSDGTSGPFSFVSTGTQGTGTGAMGGAPFTFSFG